MKKILLLLAISIANVSCVAQSERHENTRLTKKIDHYLSQGAANGFSGAVLIVKNGNIILNKGYGLANRKTQQLNTPQTVFSTGSVTKQFTATAILKLAELNKLQLTDKISTYFKGLPEDKREISIHQLLTHSAGLVDVIGGDFEEISTDEFFTKLFDTKLLYKPGTKHRYSNASYSVLARIIELVSHQEYERFLHEHLFLPAGMQQTGYLMPKWNHTSLAQGYVRGVTHWGAMIPRFQKAKSISWNLKGNGGIQSTQEDMYKWYQALASHAVLSKSSTELLTKPYIQEQEGSDESFYAYGWAIFNSDRNTKIVTHNGSNGIFFHEFMWLPEEDTIIILSTNAYSREAEVTWRLEKMLFDDEYTPKPIRKSPYFLVLDFIEKNKPSQSSELLTLMKQELGDDFKDANVFNQIGYMLLENKEKTDWMLQLFQLNVQLFPSNANLWDSLGDGYKSKGDRTNAIKAYQKALELDPTLSASQQSLAALGVAVTSNQNEVVLDAKTRQSYVGSYQLPSGHLIKILENNEKLMVEFPGRPAMKLTPKSLVKFAIGDRSASLVFNTNKDSVVESFTIFESGEQMTAKKK